MSLDMNNAWSDLSTPNFFDNDFKEKVEQPVQVGYVSDMYNDRQLQQSPFDVEQNFSDDFFLTPLLTPEESKLKVKTERNSCRLVPNITTPLQKCYSTGVGGDWQDQPPCNWTPDQVYAWLHQCMFELDRDYSDIDLANYNLTGRQLCQMTSEDFYRSAPKTGGILYNKLQSRLHNGAYTQPIIFSEDPSDDDESSDLLLDVQDDNAFNLFGSMEQCEEILDLILGKDVQPMDNNPPSPVSTTSSSNYSESDFSSLPPSPPDAFSRFAMIENGVPNRQRNNSAGEESSEDDGDVFSDTKSESSTDGMLIDKKVDFTPKCRGGKNLQMLQKKLKVKRPRGRPRKLVKLEPSSDEDDDDLMCGRRKGEGMKGNHLWEFIRDLLKSPTFNPDYIKWEDAKNGVFRIVHSEAVAKAWGKKKNNPRMTYEKLSRAMRYYYKRDILERVDGRRLVYKFGKKAYGWQEAAKVVY